MRPGCNVMKDETKQAQTDAATMDTIHIFFFFWSHFYSYFPASGQAVVSQVSSLLPPGMFRQFLRA